MNDSTFFPSLSKFDIGKVKQRVQIMTYCKSGKKMYTHPIRPILLCVVDVIGNPLFVEPYGLSKYIFISNNKYKRTSLQICTYTMSVYGVDCRVSYRNYRKYVTKSLISSKIKRKGCPIAYEVCVQEALWPRTH